MKSLVNILSPEKKKGLVNNIMQSDIMGPTCVIFILGFHAVVG